MRANNTPILMVMAGPNGSGKSTITNEYQPVGEYVNADDIQRYLNCTPLEAAKIAEATREFFLSQKVDFTFETVLSTEKNYLLMEKAKESGYTVICIYVLTVDPSINVSRVKSRVLNGGHDVPTEKIVNRYYRAMSLFPKIFSVCDECYVYDNSLERGQGDPTMILKWQYGKLELMPNSLWSIKKLESLCEGTYLKNENQTQDL